jgi:hypothetical protein
MATFMLKESTSSQKLATSMLKVTYTKCHYTELPTPLRTPQTSGHSSSYISNIPLWSLKSPPSYGSKIIIFYLSQSKCTVSALFLHGFKGCNGHSDLQNTAKDAEITWQKTTMLCTKTTKARNF